MRILFTIIDDWRDRQRDLWLEGDPATPVRSLTGILDGDGEGHPAAWWEGDRLLAAQGHLGLELHDGATLGRRPGPDQDGGRAGVPAPAVGELRALAGPHAGMRWPLPHGRHLIGRSDESTVNLFGDRRVSRRHAVLVVAPEEVVVHDEGSAHGLRLEGEPVTRCCAARGGVASGGRLGAGVDPCRPGSGRGCSRRRGRFVVQPAAAHAQSRRAGGRPLSRASAGASGRHLSSGGCAGARGARRRARPGDPQRAVLVVHAAQPGHAPLQLPDPAPGRGQELQGAGPRLRPRPRAGRDRTGQCPAAGDRVPPARRA